LVFNVDSTVRAQAAQVRLVAFDFDGVFTDNTVYVMEDGREAVRCWRSDGLGLRRLAQLDVATLILSTEVNPVVTARARKLQITCQQGLADKATALTAIVKERHLTFAQVAFVGNDINDRECLQQVGLPIGVRDAHPDILEYLLYRTQALGGRGAVREVCDLLEWAYAGSLIQH